MRSDSLLHRRVRGVVLVGLLLGSAAHAAGLEFDGFTEPYHDIDVAAAEMGVLAKIAVKEGDSVSAGQLLAQLDDEVLRATLSIAKRAMESQGRVESADAEWRMQTSIVKRLVELRDREHASPQELQRAQAKLEVAAAQLKSAREEQELKTLEFQRIQMQLAQRKLVSPIDGIVTRILKDRGEFVTLNDPVVLKVVQLDPLLAVFSVPVKPCKELKVGGPVALMIGEPPVKAQGIVEFVSPTADPQSGTVRVRVRIPNRDKRLPCGAPIQLLIDGGGESLRAPSDRKNDDIRERRR
jgi:RND family efflux transporter MFP subunit